jgi:hypothetical protein
VLRIRDPSRLFRRAILGILNLLIWGKPAERRGRKATGLKRGAMTAGLPAGRKLIVELIFEKPPWPRGRAEREQGEQQRSQEARGIVRVDRLEGYCSALGKRVIRACGARSEGLCLAPGKRVIQACGARTARSQAARERQTPSGGHCTRERTTA